MGSKPIIPIDVNPNGAQRIGALTGAEYMAFTQGGNSRVGELDDVAAFILAQVPAGGLDQAYADFHYLNNDANLGDLTDLVAARNNLSVYSEAQVDAMVAGAGNAFPREHAVTKPLVANGTLNNALAQPTWISTAVDDTYGIYMRCPKGTSAATALKFLRFASLANGGVGGAGSVWSITVRMQANSAKASSYNACLVARNPANDKMLFIGNRVSPDELDGFYGNSAGGVAVGIGAGVIPANAFPWRRFVCDGTNLVIDVSADGQQWERFFTSTLATYIGGGALELGIGMLVDNANDLAFWCQSLVIT